MSTHENERTSLHEHDPLPMRGAIMSAIATAFRLGDRCRDPDPSMSTTTAKRVLQDHPGVADEKRSAMVRVLVDSLFTADYLEVRGLAEEAEVHNELVASALEAVLDRWDDLVRGFNYGARPAGSTLAFMLLLDGVADDVLVRCAAYLVRYGRSHPLLAAIPRWLQGEGLSMVLRELISRAGREMSVERLCRDSGLTKNTWTNLRAGKTLQPQGESLAQLAAALAGYEIRRREVAEEMTAAEIELELRVACAVAQVSVWLGANESLRGSVGGHVRRLNAMRSELRCYGTDALGEIMVLQRRPPSDPPRGAFLIHPAAA